MIINLDFVIAHESDLTTLLSGIITLNGCPISSQEPLNSSIKQSSMPNKFLHELQKYELSVNLINFYWYY